MEAWRNALLEAARVGVLPGQNTLSIHTGEQLAAALEIKGLGRPLALQAVIVCESVVSAAMTLYQS